MLQVFAVETLVAKAAQPVPVAPVIVTVMPVDGR
jgi:hypothetical protein